MAEVTLKEKTHFRSTSKMNALYGQSTNSAMLEWLCHWESSRPHPPLLRWWPLDVWSFLTNVYWSAPCFILDKNASRMPSSKSATFLLWKTCAPSCRRRALFSLKWNVKSQGKSVKWQGKSFSKSHLGKRRDLPLWRLLHRLRSPPARNFFHLWASPKEHVQSSPISFSSFVSLLKKIQCLLAKVHCCKSNTTSCTVNEDLRLLHCCTAALRRRLLLSAQNPFILASDTLTCSDTCHPVQGQPSCSICTCACLDFKIHFLLVLSPPVLTLIALRTSCSLTSDKAQGNASIIFQTSTLKATICLKLLLLGSCILELWSPPEHQQSGKNLSMWSTASAPCAMSSMHQILPSTFNFCQAAHTIWRCCNDYIAHCHVSHTFTCKVNWWKKPEKTWKNELKN